MPCLFAILILAFPRVAIVLLYFFTHFFSGLFEGILIPLLVFIFLPLTLLAYAMMANMHQPHDTVFLIVMFIAVVLDLGLLGGGHRLRTRN